MQNYYEKEVLITSTYADRRCEVGIFQAGILIQDAMTEFFTNMIVMPFKCLGRIKPCGRLPVPRFSWIRIFCGWTESELKSSRSKSPTSLFT